MLAASRSQERFGSHAPSIRAGDRGTGHLRLPAWSLEAGLSFYTSVPLGNPDAATETRTSLDVRVSRASDECW